MQHDDDRFKAHLENWMEGDFTHSDEKSLKKLTDPDDFRREAMEGFAAVPEGDHAERLASMRRRLRENPSQLAGSRMRPLYWPALAAAIALLIGAFFFFKNQNVLNDAKIAQNTPTAPLEETHSPGSDELAATEALPSPVTAPGPTTTEHDLAAAKTRAPAKPEVLSAPSGALPGSARQTNAAAETAALPVDDAITSANKDAEIVAEAPIQAAPAPAQLPAAPAATSVKPTERARKSDASAAKKSHRTEDKANMDSIKNTARAVPMPVQSEPEGGWEEWNAYLRQNARLTPEARNNNISGSVLVQFSVDANGDPQNIFFLRRLGYGCDEEAIRLIRSWAWIPGKSNIAKVEIPFIR